MAGRPEIIADPIRDIGIFWGEGAPPDDFLPGFSSEYHDDSTGDVYELVPGSGWEQLGTGAGGITEAAADARYVQLAADNTLTGVLTLGNSVQTQGNAFYGNPMFGTASDSKPGGVTAAAEAVLKFYRAGTFSYSYNENAEFRIGHGGPSVYGSQLELWINGPANTTGVPDTLVQVWYYNGTCGFAGGITTQGHVTIENGGYLYSPKGTVGSYNAGYGRLIYAIGDAYKGTSDSSGLISSYTSLYGFVSVYDDSTGTGLNWSGHTLGHGMAVIDDGAYRSIMAAGGFHTKGNVWADANIIAGGQVSCNTLGVTGGISCGGISIGGYSPTVVRSGTATTVPGDLTPNQAYFGY